MNRRGAAFTTNDEGKRKEYIAAHASHNSDEVRMEHKCYAWIGSIASLWKQKKIVTQIQIGYYLFLFFIPISFSCKRTYTDELQTLA